MPDISEENGVQCSFEFSSLLHTVETQLSPADQERGTCIYTYLYVLHVYMHVHVGYILGRSTYSVQCTCICTCRSHGFLYFTLYVHKYMYMYMYISFLPPSAKTTPYPIVLGKLMCGCHISVCQCLGFL